MSNLLKSSNTVGPNFDTSNFYVPQFTVEYEFKLKEFKIAWFKEPIATQFSYTSTVSVLLFNEDYYDLPFVEIPLTTTFLVFEESITLPYVDNAITVNTIFIKPNLIEVTIG